MPDRKGIRVAMDWSPATGVTPKNVEFCPVFGKYLLVLKTPGAMRFSVAGFVGRIQMSMIGLGAVLLLQQERGSYAIAGAVSAIYALSMAVIGPQVSRLIDLLGQRRVLLVQLVIHLPAMGLLVLLALSGSPVWTLFIFAFIAGAAQPNVGPLVRARWSHKLTGTGSLRTAFAWESLLDEVIFIAGPPLATMLALSLFSSAAIVAATVLVAIGTLWFAAQRSTEPPVAEPDISGTKTRPAITLPGVAAVTAVYVLMGGMFGSWEVSTVAFAEEHGWSGAAGIILALNAVGSLCGGVVFGALNLRWSLLRQFLASLIVLAIGFASLPHLHAIWLLMIGALISGVAVAPVLISGMALIERIVPMSRLTESMSWPSAGVAVGLAVASPIAGVVIDAHGGSVAYWITSGCAAAAAVVAWAQLSPLRRASNAAAARIAAGTQRVADYPADEASFSS